MYISWSSESALSISAGCHPVIVSFPQMNAGSYARSCPHPDEAWTVGRSRRALMWPCVCLWSIPTQKSERKKGESRFTSHIPCTHVTRQHVTSASAHHSLNQSLVHVLLIGAELNITKQCHIELFLNARACVCVVVCVFLFSCCAVSEVGTFWSSQLQGTLRRWRLLYFLFSGSVLTVGSGLANDLFIKVLIKIEVQGVYVCMYVCAAFQKKNLNSWPFLGIALMYNWGIYCPFTFRLVKLEQMLFWISIQAWIMDAL